MCSSKNCSTLKTAAHFLNNSFFFAGFGIDDAWQCTILFTFMQPNASHVLYAPLRIPHGRLAIFFFFTVPQTRQICQFIGILRLEWRPMCWRWRGDSNDIWVHADQYHRVTCKSMVQTSLLLAWMAALVIVESVMIIIHVHVTGMANKRNKKIIIMIMIIKHFCIVHYNTDLSCETCSWSVNGYLYIQWHDQPIKLRWFPYMTFGFVIKKDILVC